MADWWANLFGGAQAEAPSPLDISDAPAPSADPEVQRLLKLTAADIEGYAPAAVVDVLNVAFERMPDNLDHTLVETCCKQLRVLCRDPANCALCDQAQCAKAVVQCMGKRKEGN